MPITLGLELFTRQPPRYYRTDRSFTLSAICKAVPIPVVAIGGLNLSNLDILKGSGADGIAVVSAIMKAENPRKAAEELLMEVKQL